MSRDAGKLHGRHVCGAWTTVRQIIVQWGSPKSFVTVKRWRVVTKGKSWKYEKWDREVYNSTISLLASWSNRFRASEGLKIRGKVVIRLLPVNRASRFPPFRATTDPQANRSNPSSQVHHLNDSMLKHSACLRWGPTLPSFPCACVQGELRMRCRTKFFDRPLRVGNVFTHN